MLINVQPLLEIINPIAAFEYQSLEGKIKNLKKNLIIYQESKKKSA